MSEVHHLSDGCHCTLPSPQYLSPARYKKQNMVSAHDKNHGKPIGSMQQFFYVRKHLIKGERFGVEEVQGGRRVASRQRQWKRILDDLPASATRFIDIANHLIKLSHKVTGDSLRLFVPAPRSTWHIFQVLHVICHWKDSFYKAISCCGYRFTGLCCPSESFLCWILPLSRANYLSLRFQK